jgi:hypothetical protein
MSYSFTYLTTTFAQSKCLGDGPRKKLKACQYPHMGHNTRRKMVIYNLFNATLQP